MTLYCKIHQPFSLQEQRTGLRFLSELAADMIYHMCHQSVQAPLVGNRTVSSRFFFLLDTFLSVLDSHVGLAFIATSGVKSQVYWVLISGGRVECEVAAENKKSEMQEERESHSHFGLSQVQIHLHSFGPLGFFKNIFPHTFPVCLCVGAPLSCHVSSVILISSPRDTEGILVCK